MKKVCILFVSCVLWFCSFGQGTAYLTKSYASGYSKLIRQYRNSPGQQVVCFTDDVTDTKCYIGVTDVYTNINYVQICDKCAIYDLEVLGDTAYFCGQTFTNKGLLGWLDLQSWTIGIDSAIFTDSFCSPGITSVDNIEVFYRVGNPTIVGYGKKATGYAGFDYTIVTPSSCNLWTDDLPYKPLDITLTNQHIVFSGDLSSGGVWGKMVIQPFLKSAILFTMTAPYYIYSVGPAPADEPYNSHLRIVDIGNDVVTTLTHRLEAGVYGFVLREFDLSQAFVSYNVPMTSAHYVKYNYSIGDLYDFRYNVPLNMYTLFQNYEVTPSDYKDVVTKIDFSSGTPSTVESDYHNIPYQDMVSMSLSDSAMYVVYGYDMTSKAFVFWKDYQKVSASGRCLGADFLPVHTISTIPTGRVVGTVAGTYCPGSTLSQTRTPINKRIYNLCH